MKKICYLLSCLLLLQLLIGCSGKDKEIVVPINFYYINTDISYNTPSGVISAEIREGSQFNNLEDLLQEYLKGPASPELQSLIPADVMLISCAVDHENAYVLLSSQFGELSDVKLTAVCSAMLLTVHDFTGVQTLSVSLDGSQLDERDAFVLSMDDIVLMDTVTADKVKE